MQSSTPNYSCYIIYSKNLNKFYIGITSEGILKRLEKHNNHNYGSHFTSKADDWEIAIDIPCDSASMARRMEIYIKKMKSRIFIQKLIKDSSECEKLIEKIKSI